MAGGGHLRGSRGVRRPPRPSAAGRIRPPRYGGGAVKLFSKSAKVPNGRKAFEQLPLADRVITFYAEDAGSWPHFAPIVEALTGDLGLSICYLTSAADDPILEAGRPNVKPFSIGEGV